MKIHNSKGDKRTSCGTPNVWTVIVEEISCIFIYPIEKMFTDSSFSYDINKNIMVNAIKRIENVCVNYIDLFTKSKCIHNVRNEYQIIGSGGAIWWKPVHRLELDWMHVWSDRVSGTQNV